MKKICLKHDIEKIRIKGNISLMCKECRREARLRSYHNNKDKQQARTKAFIAKRRQLIQSLKEGPCSDCGVGYSYYVMDWDHKKGEEKSFTLALAAAYKGLEDVLKEIAKCDLVCANCHRERTHQRRAAAQSENSRMHKV